MQIRECPHFLYRIWIRGLWIGGATKRPIIISGCLTARKQPSYFYVTSFSKGRESILELVKNQSDVYWTRYGHSTCVRPIRVAVVRSDFATN